MLADGHLKMKDKFITKQGTGISYMSIKVVMHGQTNQLKNKDATFITQSGPGTSKEYKFRLIAINHHADIEKEIVKIKYMINIIYPIV